MKKCLPVTSANEYISPVRDLSWLANCSPILAFYPGLLWIILRSGILAKLKRYDGTAWAVSSADVLHQLEKAGCRLEITGLDNFRGAKPPCVFVANHMSTLETFVLPCLIQPWCNTTFVVKESLLKYPLFGDILGSRDPIVVGRKNPREDLKAVLEKGGEHLAKGTSLVIFPQSTRSQTFQREHFNTIGIKVARQAGVPVVPVALKTDAWAEGSLIKDFGRIYPERTIHCVFAEPLPINGNGKAEHAQICDFIAGKLAEWTQNDQPVP